MVLQILPVDGLKYILDNDLCTRCGTCAGVCHADCITLDDSKYPVFNASCMECGKCIKVCPGIDVDFPELTMQLFNKKFEINNVLGFFSNAYAGYASNPNIRGNASSGGVVTQLLTYLLRKKIIKGAIVTIMNPQSPWESTVIIAETEDELLQSMQSRYTIVPVNRVLGKIKQMEGKFALVGLPCHIHGFRKLVNMDPVITDKIFVVLGLFCHRTLEQQATIDLLKNSRIPQNEIKKLEYRGGDWPGGMRIIKKNGNIIKLHSLNIKDGAFNYLSRLYFPKRCLYCIDGSSELADISFADPWVRDHNNEKLFKEGWTLVFERTEKGAKLLAGAKNDSAIIFNKIDRDDIYKKFSHNNMIINKRKMALFRLSMLKSKNKPVPEYHFAIPSMTANDRLKVSVYSLFSIYAKNERIRHIFVKILFSRMGFMFTRFRLFIKYRLLYIRKSYIGISRR